VASSSSPCSSISPVRDSNHSPPYLASRLTPKSVSTCQRTRVPAPVSSTSMRDSNSRSRPDCTVAVTRSYGARSMKVRLPFPSAPPCQRIVSGDSPARPARSRLAAGPTHGDHSAIRRASPARTKTVAAGASTCAARCTRALDGRKTPTMTNASSSRPTPYANLLNLFI
jgi:hypothetical protein